MGSERTRGKDLQATPSSSKQLAEGPPQQAMSNPAWMPVQTHPGQDQQMIEPAWMTSQQRAAASGPPQQMIQPAWAPQERGALQLQQNPQPLGDFDPGLASLARQSLGVDLSHVMVSFMPELEAQGKLGMAQKGEIIGLSPKLASDYQVTLAHEIIHIGQHPSHQSGKKELEQIPTHNNDKNTMSPEEEAVRLTPLLIHGQTLNIQCSVGSEMLFQSDESQEDLSIEGVTVVGDSMISDPVIPGTLDQSICEEYPEKCAEVICQNVQSLCNTERSWEQVPDPKVLEKAFAHAAVEKYITPEIKIEIYRLIKENKNKEALETLMTVFGRNLRHRGVKSNADGKSLKSTNEKGEQQDIQEEQGKFHFQTGQLLTDCGLSSQILVEGLNMTGIDSNCEVKEQPCTGHRYVECSKYGTSHGDNIYCGYSPYPPCSQVFQEEILSSSDAVSRANQEDQNACDLAKKKPSEFQKLIDPERWLEMGEGRSRLTDEELLSYRRSYSLDVYFKILSPEKEKEIFQNGKPNYRLLKGMNVQTNESIEGFEVIKFNFMEISGMIPDRILMLHAGKDMKYLSDSIKYDMDSDFNRVLRGDCVNMSIIGDKYPTNKDELLDSIVRTLEFYSTPGTTQDYLNAACISIDEK